MFRDINTIESIPFEITENVKHLTLYSKRINRNRHHIISCCYLQAKKATEVEVKMLTPDGWCFSADYRDSSVAIRATAIILDFERYH